MMMFKFHKAVNWQARWLLPAAHLLDLIRFPQIVERLHSVTSTLQRASTTKERRNNCFVRQSIEAQAETASAKRSDGCSQLRHESLSRIVTELILMILDVDRLKTRLCLRC